MGSDTLVTVIAPLQNDAPILPAFVAEVSEALRAHYANYEVVLVDDHSTDATAEVARGLLGSYPCLRLIQLSRPFGADVAVTAGLDAAIGDYAVVMRPRSDPPAAIPAMVALAAAGHGLVVGISPRDAGRGPLVALGRRAFFWLIRRLMPQAPPFDATGFCALSRPAINAVTRVKSKHRHLGFLSCALGFDAATFPYAQIARGPRAKLRPLREAVDEAVAGLVTHSVFPLRMASQVGAFAAGLNLLYVAYILVVNLVKQRVAEGWTTASIQQSCMFFLLFVHLTILSEYIAHILREAQDRPLYHVADEKVSTVRTTQADRRNVA